MSDGMSIVVENMSGFLIILLFKFWFMTCYWKCSLIMMQTRI